MSIRDLAYKHNYLDKNIKYIKNGLIQEYDMKNGGISILYHNKLLSQDDYDYLMNDLDKLQRNIAVGKWLKDNPKASVELMDGFKMARDLFLSKNEVQPENVLSIKKDAIFLVNTSVKVEQVNEDYLFRKKNEYTTYINLGHKEFYYNVVDDILDVKGISETAQLMQKDYLLKFIKECLKLDSDGKKEELFIKLLEFKDSFIKRELSKEYYYDIILDGYMYSNNDHLLMLSEINDELVKNKYLVIGSNLNIILELISNVLT